MKIFRKKNLKKIIYILAIILLVYRILESIYTYEFKYLEWKNKKIEVMVEYVDKIKEDRVDYIVNYNGDKFILSLKNNTNIYSSGDKLNIICSNYSIEKLNNPHEFNYKRYLSSKGFVSKIYSSKVVSKVGNSKNYITLANYIREKITDRIDSIVKDKKISGFIQSITYGEDRYLDEHLKTTFSNVGLGHILCISGTHVIFLIMTFEKITKNTKKQVLNVFILVYLYYVSLFSISLFRACVMYILTIIFKKIDFMKKYLVAIYLTLIINPYYIFNIGVILSFLSILSIKVFNPIITSFFVKYIKMKRKITKLIIDNIALTISSQILILPILVYVFGKISLICIFSNLVISLILPYFMYFDFSFFILIFVPYLSNMLSIIVVFLSKVIIFQVELLDKINYFNIILPKPNIIVFLSYYCVIIIYLFEGRIWIKFWNNRKIIKKILRYIITICMLCIIVFNIYIKYLSSYVIYFNVGQGNMALIHNYNVNIIVDCGSTQENLAYNVLYNYLKGERITKIDAILITHFHADHVNAIEKIIEEYRCEYVVFKRPVTMCEEYTNIRSKLKKYNISCIETHGDNIKIRDIEFKDISSNYIIKDEDMLNANSSIYLVKKKSKNYLFMGDSTIKSEKYLLENNVIKDTKIYGFQISHHGSNTSSLPIFIQSLDIKNAIISSKKSIYGHPSESVLNTLENLKIKYYITEKNGAIEI